VNTDGKQDEVPARLSIGRFARLTGLSVGALRHYDDLDLLRPAEVDPFTSYRSYAADQVEVGRAIARLRDLEVPLEEIRAVLGADDPAEQRRRVAGHAARVQARVDRQVRILHVLRQLSQGKERIVTTTATETDTLDPETHRRLGKELYNHTWSLIEASDRTPEQVDEMLAATHASAYHWSKAGGTLANAARGQWQIARVYSTLGRGEPALWHAHRCVELAEAAAGGGVADDWDVPAALETLARAQAVAGDAVAARATQARARAALDGIADPEDRQLIEQDLDALPI
jgi:DNA-binding transcriptional MerR regulator